MFHELTKLARLAGALATVAALCSPELRACGGYGSPLPPAADEDEAVAPLVLASADAAPAAAGTLAERQPIDLALCLDTSGSMDGLLESAKERLWTLVNDLALAEPLPDLRVALLTYGNDGYSPEDGWVRLDVPFTRDLDVVSERLFALSTNGGTELVGRVVGVAHGMLDWVDRADALKLIVVAGNESADQDQQVPYAEAAGAAIAAGVQVNAIYCGNPDDGDAESWRHVAALADGRFASIEADGGTVAIATPYDTRLAELSGLLNETYLPFGDEGQWGLSNQARQDSNAVGLSSSAVAARAVSKAGKLYNCSWDLVDALANEQVVLAEVEEEALPEALAGLSLEEREAHVEELASKRQELQEQIQTVGAERASWLAAERARLAVDSSRALDDVLCSAVRAQAEAKGFVFVDGAASVEDAPAPLPAPGEPQQAEAQVLELASGDDC